MGSSLPEEIHEICTVYPLLAQPSHLPSHSEHREISVMKLFCADLVLSRAFGNRGPQVPVSHEVVWGAHFLTARSNRILPVSVGTSQLASRGKEWRL